MLKNGDASTCLHRARVLADIAPVVVRVELACVCMLVPCARRYWRYRAQLESREQQ